VTDLAEPQSSTPLRQRVQILLATFNGAVFLDEQLRSLEAQTWPDIDILASDDGSSDATLDILQRWQARWARGRFEITGGPRSGFADNFRSLILGGAPVAGTMVAFCDQDDVWDPDKLEVAADVLSEIDAATPALYGSRTRLIDEAGRAIGLSPLFSRPPGFGNALVQSLVGGNTVVFNPTGFALLQESARRTAFPMHDWWSYLIVTGAGGIVCYDPVPHIGYRQHGGSTIGGPIGLLARPRRLLQLLQGRFVRWMDSNIGALDHCRDLLSEAARQALDNLKRARIGNGISSLSLLRGARIYRQTKRSSVWLFAAALLKRI
jgi:glycosyltransferase involved in cell wall biosynthesis